MAKVSHQRKKSDPLTITETFKLASRDIELKVKTSVETWRELIDVYYFEDQSLISNAFDEIIRESITFLETKKRRGIDAEGIEFSIRMKRYCAYIYCICEYWLKKPRQEWPDPIKEAVGWLKKLPRDRPEGINKIGGSLTLVAPDGRTIKEPNAPILTAFFAEKYFYKERRKNGFKKWSDHFGTFRRTFITNNKRYIKHYRKKILPLLFRRLRKYKKNLPLNTGNLPEIFEAMKRSFPGI